MIKSRDQPTRAALVEAALRSLGERGFAASTSRVIAQAANVNQALVFYYFGSLDGLLLAALDESIGRRLDRYRAEVGAAGSLAELVPRLAPLYEEDRASGHVHVVAQMVAGSLSRPALRDEVARRVEPWAALVEETLERLLGGTGALDLVPARELAWAAVTFYLGVNLLGELDDDERTRALFERVATLAPLLSAFAGSPDRPSTSPGPASGR